MPTLWSWTLWRLYRCTPWRFPAIPVDCCVFLGMLYSYTYILEVKLLAGPKGAGNQPDVIILYVNIYIYICIFIYTYYLNSSMKHFKWDNAQKALLSSYEHVNRFCACGKHMLRVYYKTLYCSCFAIEQDTDNRKKKHIKYHWGLAWQHIQEWRRWPLPLSDR